MIFKCPVSLEENLNENQVQIYGIEVNEKYYFHFVSIELLIKLTSCPFTRSEEFLPVSFEEYLMITGLNYESEFSSACVSKKLFEKTVNKKKENFRNQDKKRIHMELQSRWMASIENNEHSNNLILAFKILESASLVTRENLKLLIENSEHSPKIASGLRILSTNHLYSEENIKIIKSNPKFSFYLAYLLNELKNSGLNTEENFFLLEKNKNFSLDLANCLKYLINSGLNTSDNWKFISSNPKFCHQLLDGLKILEKFKLNNKNNRLLISDNPEHAKKTATCFARLNIAKLDHQLNYSLIARNHEISTDIVNYLINPNKNIKDEIKEMIILNNAKIIKSELLSSFKLDEEKILLNNANTLKEICYVASIKIKDSFFDFKHTTLISKKLVDLLNSPSNYLIKNHMFPGYNEKIRMRDIRNFALNGHKNNFTKTKSGYFLNNLDRTNQDYFCKSKESFFMFFNKLKSYSLDEISTAESQGVLSI
ncbi:hypothetical protein PsalN5692_02898 [Piscirickettsia salmonis]|nr:hypothetical protein PsalN5692_02898 [Piscirickettsia salmonis]